VAEVTDPRWAIRPARRSSCGRQEDSCIASNFLDGYRDALPVSEVRHLARAGHWPWQGHPELIEQIGLFLDGRT
jgi:hypothetical protein